MNFRLVFIGLSNLVLFVLGSHGKSFQEESYSRIVAIADFHGDLKSTHRVMKMAGLLGEMNARQLESIHLHM